MHIFMILNDDNIHCSVSCINCAVVRSCGSISQNFLAYVMISSIIACSHAAINAYCSSVVAQVRWCVHGPAARDLPSSEELGNISLNSKLFGES